IVPNWRSSWPSWRAHTELIELRERTSENMQELVYRFYEYSFRNVRGRNGQALAPAQADAIVQESRGLPLAAAMAVEMAEFPEAETPAPQTSARPSVLVPVAYRLLRNVPNSPRRLRDALQAAAVLRSFDADALQAVLQLAGSAEAADLYHELSCWRPII